MKLPQLRIPSQLQSPTPTLWHATMLAALVGLVGLSLPWVWADDHAKPYQGIGLMLHWVTATDKWYLARTAPLDALCATVAPALIIGLSAWSAFKVYFTRRVGFDTAGRALMVLFAGLAVLWLCDDILDPDRGQLGPLAAPGIGLIMVLASALVTVVCGLRGVTREAGIREQWEQNVQMHRPMPEAPPDSALRADAFARHNESQAAPEPEPRPAAAPTRGYGREAEPGTAPREGYDEPGEVRRGYGPRSGPEPSAAREGSDGSGDAPRRDADDIYRPAGRGHRTPLRDRYRVLS